MTPAELERALKENGAPKQMEWDAKAPIAFGPIISIDAGAVQFHGRAPFMLKGEAMTVPFPILFVVMGQMLQVLASATPEGAAMRALIGGNRTMPANHVPDNPT